MATAAHSIVAPFPGATTKPRRHQLRTIRRAVAEGAALDLCGVLNRRRKDDLAERLAQTDAFDFAADMIAAMVATLSQEQREVFYNNARLMIRPGLPDAYKRAAKRMARFG